MFVNRRTFIKITLGVLVSSQVGCDLSPPPDLDKKKVLLVYWIISILQPIDQISLVSFIKMIEDYIWQDVSKEEARRSIDFLIEEGYLIAFLNSRSKFFSVSPKLKFKLAPKERLNKDRLRFFLLSTLDIGNVGGLGEVSKLLVDGDSPSTEQRLPIQLRIGSKGRQSQPLNSPWVSLNESTSFAASPYPSLLSPYHYSLSYPDVDFIKEIEGNIPPHLFVRHILAYDLGFSLQLITRVLANKRPYYRKFKVPKKSGGFREVSSPRTYLKVILLYIKANLFTGLKVHDSVHSYRKGRSFLTNAQEHVGQKFVLNIDLENYFSSITIYKVREVLEKSGFSQPSVKLLSSLCTLDNSLPQGSPTSPIISNSVLYRVDSFLYRYCKRKNLNYTRYSDDITISGESKLAIEKASTIFSVMVKKAGFKVNNKKTRLMPYHKRQQVTGVVVNEVTSPPRDVMRKIRAKFHHAYKGKVIDVETKDMLLGNISYLSAFDKYKGSDLVKKYKYIMDNINVIRK